MNAEKKPTPEERAKEIYHKYMANQKSDVALSVVKDHVVRKVAEEIENGTASDDVKQRATRAFDTIDSTERKHANVQMRRGQTSFDLDEHDLIVALAGVEEVEDFGDAGEISGTRYSAKNTARCRIGAIGMDEYLRWDFIQDANRRAANEAYDRGKARFAPYLPFFQQGLTVQEIDDRGLIHGNTS